MSVERILNQLLAATAQMNLALRVSAQAPRAEYSPPGSFDLF